MSRSEKIDSLCEQVMLASALGGVFLGMGGFISQSMFWLGCVLMVLGFCILCLATLIQGRVRREALALEEEAQRLTIESLRRDILDMLARRY